MELIGSFADINGNIIGIPFVIGKGPISVTVPNIAAKIQLGFNDDVYSDNLGSVTVEIIETCILDTAPILISTIPSDNATAVAVDSNITLTFSEAVKADTGNIVISNGSDERTISVTDSAQVTFNSNTVTINPNNNLQAGTSYHVEIARGAITDESGNIFAGISDAETLDFVTTILRSNGQPLYFYNNHYYQLTTVSMTWSQAEAEAVAFGGHLVTINDMQENTWLSSTFCSTYRWIGLNDIQQEENFVWADGSPVIYTNWFSGEPNRLGDEDAVEIYTPNLDAKWNDVNVLKSQYGIIEYAINESTTDTTAPTVVSATPSDNAAAVAVASNITLTFSENVQAGTGNIVVSNGSDERTISVSDSSQVTFDGSRLTINPTDDLQGGTSYHVEIANGVIQDTAGNAFAGISDAETLNFETINALSGHITFWKTGEAITDITTTLTALPTNGTQHAIELKNIHVKADGSHTVEVWATTPNSTTGSFECEFVLPTGANATWQDAAKLPAGWTSTSNTIASGNFLVDGMSTNPMAEGQVKLGTLTITQATNSDTFELAMAHAQLGDDDVAGYAISSVSSTTGSGNEYSYHALTDGHYALTGDKAAGVAGRAVHANDALAALKMAVELNPNDDGSFVLPYQYLAADINRDGKVRANDALNILKMAVGIESAPDDEWIFVSEAVADKTMDRTHVDWSDLAPTIDFNQTSVDLDLIGIVKGDVDGSWAA